MIKLKTVVAGLFCLFLGTICSSSFDNTWAQTSGSAGWAKNDFVLLPIENVIRIETGYHNDSSTRYIDFWRFVPTAVADDLQAIGYPDILLRNTSTGASVLWFMNPDGTVAHTRTLFTAVNSTIVSTGDFNGDGITDLIKRDIDSGRVSIWFMNTDGTRESYKTIFTEVNSTIVGTGDFNADGICDLIKRDSVTGQSVLWFMNADGTRASYKVLFTDVNATVAGTGDFNGDGIFDLIKRNSVSGQTVLWFMNANGTRASYKIILTMPTWTVVGTGNINGDGITDIIWRNTGTNQYNLWLMNANGTHATPVTLLALANWSLAGTGDVNVDGLTDLIWRNTNGLMRLWFMNSDGSHETPVTLLNDLNWTVVPALMPVSDGLIIADHTAAAHFNTIPAEAITQAKSKLHIAYGHTSHGSQLITGMDVLAASDSVYSWNHGGSGGALDLEDYAMGGDVGYYPDWVNNTRSYLGAPNPATGRGTTNPDVNVIVWSWCGQASSKTQQTMITEYLSPMNQLEAEYPGVRFVYMTGHLDGSGQEGDLNIRNEQIRSYCKANGKTLFDFADIESYDPDGATNYMPLYCNDNCDYSGGHNWAGEWIAINPANPLTALANSCGECAHSQTLNCVLKGRAVWWLWARIAGWNGIP